jgi:thiamine biosynthesis lipoprotein
MSTTGYQDWEQWTSPARLVVTDPSRLGEAVALAKAHLAQVDRAASRFRPDSELVTLRRDADRGVLVSDLLADLLREALLAAELSGGYDRDIRLVQHDDAPLRAVVRRVPGWRSLRLEGNRLFCPAGVRLDLGATAKAVAADRIAAQVAAELGTGVLVSLGGDIATAGIAPTGGWQVAVQDVPADPEARISLAAGTALATSSTVRRSWQRDGVRYHHVVDPETSQSADPVWRSVSVVGVSCVEANTISTAALVKGRAALDWVAHTGASARLVGADGDVVVLNGWPEERAA